MKRLLATRLAGGMLTVGVSMLVVFFIVRLIPGDPIVSMIERSGSPELEAALKRLYGLDQPIHVQLATWVANMAGGDFGISIINRQPVLDEVLTRIPRTLYLMVGGVAVAVLVAFPAGLIAALNHRKWRDTTVVSATTLLLAVPQFFFGILLIFVFAVVLRWLPATGWVDPMQDIGGSLKSMLLPWLTIGLTASAFIARVLRSSLLDVLNQDYIRAGRARGLSEPQVLRWHALRNAALPAVTVVGLEVGYLLGGAIVVEKVYSFPGMGTLIVNSIVSRDYPTVQVSILFFVIAFVIVNLVTDLSYGVLDARIRTAR